jgi:hypothetical protein
VASLPLESTTVLVSGSSWSVSSVGAKDGAACSISWAGASGAAALVAAAVALVLELEAHPGKTLPIINRTRSSEKSFLLFIRFTSFFHILNSRLMVCALRRRFVIAFLRMPKANFS